MEISASSSQTPSFQGDCGPKILERRCSKRYTEPMISLDRITVDPQQMNGQPCLRGTRYTVRRVLEIAALYPNRAERMAEFPELEDEDFRQALHYASLHLPDQIVTLDPDALVA